MNDVVAWGGSQSAWAKTATEYEAAPRGYLRMPSAAHPIAASPRPHRRSIPPGPAENNVCKTMRTHPVCKNNRSRRRERGESYSYCAIVEGGRKAPPGHARGRADWRGGLSPPPPPASLPRPLPSRLRLLPPPLSPSRSSSPPPFLHDAPPCRRPGAAGGTGCRGKAEGRGRLFQARSRAQCTPGPRVHRTTSLKPDDLGKLPAMNCM